MNKNITIGKIPENNVIPEYLHQISNFQIINYFASKNKQQIKEAGAGLFLLNLSELEELNKLGLVSVAIKKEGKDIVGYGIAIPGNLEIRNLTLNRLKEKFEIEKKENCFIVEWFLSEEYKINGNEDGLVNSILRTINEKTTGAEIFVPFEAISHKYEEYFKKYELRFNQDPNLILTSDNGYPCRVIYTGHKKLEAV